MSVDWRAEHDATGACCAVVGADAVRSMVARGRMAADAWGACDVFAATVLLTAVVTQLLTINDAAPCAVRSGAIVATGVPTTTISLTCKMSLL